jgi:phosphoribosylanthranilate isomerase
MSKNKIQVKICGITRKGDLKCAESQGADYIGFINVQRSPRFQDIVQIKKLFDKLNEKDRAVMVLEPSTPDEAYESIANSEIINIQLHGMNLKDFRQLKNRLAENPTRNLISVIGISDENMEEYGISLEETKKQEIISFAEISEGILFDYQIKGKSGGTGKQIPLSLAIESSKIVKAANKDIKIFLAGGMDIKRLEEEGNLICQFFDGVDFNSSLEDAPGIKNKDKIRELMQLTKEFNCQ